MPESCRYMRTRLQIEYLRLTNWAEVAGLIEYKEGQDLPDSLKADRLVLIAILTEIRALMDDFANLNGKYSEQLRPNDSATAKKEAEELDLVEEFSSISLEYEKKAVERKYIRGTNHIVNHMRMAKDIAKNPKRLVWVAFDEQVFVKLLGRLTELNDYLQELLHGQQARKLEQVTEKTYMEMVQVRSSVEELKHLVTAAMLLEDRGHSATNDIRRRNDQVLARLASFKSLNAAHEDPDGQKPPDYDSVISTTHLNNSQVYYQEDPSSTSSRSRAEGKFFPGDGTFTQVWIEWKTYKEKWDQALNKYVPQDENVRRVRELAALLQSSKPQEFCSPRCLGYFDDRDDAEQSEHDYRFGLVFEKPVDDLHPVSLHDLLKTPIPSLTERISLAHKISVCVLYLHAVNWLHKSLRSDSIIFFPPSRSITEPYLTGYEYARADRPGETTTGGDVDEWTELYVHPNYQGPGTKGLYRKTFDIYSLGIVLLEIAYWQPIEKIMGLNMESQTIFEDIKKIRERLLQPRSDVMEMVKANLGDRYFGAVKSCILGREAFGIGSKEDEVRVQVGAKLQQGFTRLVTDGLEGISL
ncbi:MAG: hypothetical protein LQ338_001781 [Usnochroma carphineum]|nr:MAG: hypothetical protein LQ338_001781 [Usnochroma carphineum]